ncbi:MAG: hypothetical protein IKZ99_08215 [Salinivirgaceae bacterium]|nr:hypothetical protein [Salinivirgaceae bacterium]
MKRLFIFSFLLLFVGVSCSDKKNTQTTIDKKNAEIKNADSVENLQVMESENVVALLEDEQNNDKYYNWYNQLRKECNSKLTYCKSVIIGTDTIFFTTNDVNKNGLDNYMLPYNVAKKILNCEQPEPLYSVSVTYEKDDIIAIILWLQGDCFWPDFLYVFEKSTGKILSKELILSEGCGDFTMQSQITLKGDTLTVYEVIDNYHEEVGYLHDEYKNCYIVKEFGGIEKINLLSAPDKFKNGKVDFNDESVLHFFELISIISDDCLGKCGVDWNGSDRKYMLYTNVKYEGRLIKSHPQMRSINYSNYNLVVDFEKSVSNFHLYKAEDEREFLVISTIDSSTMNGHIAAYQYKESAFVELEDFFPAQPSQTAIALKSYLFDGDTITQSYINTDSNQTVMRKYVFDKAKGVMVDDD